MTKGSLSISVLRGERREEGSSLTRRRALPGKAVLYPLLVVYGNRLSRQKSPDVVLSWCRRLQLSARRQAVRPLLLPQPARVLPSLRQTANVFKVEYSVLFFFFFLNFFTDSGGLCVSSGAEPGRSTEDQRQQNGGQPGQRWTLAFFLIQGETRFQYHSLQDAWDTLELVRLLRALQINVPVSISFCRSTPFRGKKDTTRIGNRFCHVKLPSNHRHHWERLVGGEGA